MKDTDALDFLAGKLDGNAAVATALGISIQRLHNWRTRGISAKKRAAVWAMVNDHGGNLSRDWLLSAAVPAQQGAAA